MGDFFWRVEMKYFDYKLALFLKMEQGLGVRKVAETVKCSKSEVSNFLKSFFEYEDKSILSYPLQEEITNEKIF